jgi:hypothetical protein
MNASQASSTKASPLTALTYLSYNMLTRLGSRSGAGRRSVVTLRTENARALEGGNSTKMKLLSILVEVQKLAGSARQESFFFFFFCFRIKRS